MTSKWKSTVAGLFSMLLLTGCGSTTTQLKATVALKQQAVQQQTNAPTSNSKIPVWIQKINNEYHGDLAVFIETGEGGSATLNFIPPKDALHAGFGGRDRVVVPTTAILYPKVLYKIQRQQFEKYTTLEVASGIPATAVPSIEATSVNLSVQDVASATTNEVTVGSMIFKAPHFIHGYTEPIVLTLHIQPISKPLNVSPAKLGLNNPASLLNGGGVDYVKYQGKIYKLNSRIEGDFLVRTSFSFASPGSLIMVGEVGTPTPLSQKIEITYDKQLLGSFSVAAEKVISV